MARLVSFWEKTASACWSAAGLCVLSAVAIPALLAFLWLKNGTWPHETVADALPDPPHADWVGVQKILDQLLTCPAWFALSVCCVIAGIACGLFAKVASDEGERLRRGPSG